MKKRRYWLSLFVPFIICLPMTSLAEPEVDSKVTQILNAQLDALKRNSYESFLKRGNKAFKEIFSEFDFESLYLNSKSELSREYDLKYLGSIQRVGIIQYLWKFKNRDTKREHLIRLTLSRNGEYVVGFDFD